MAFYGNTAIYAEDWATKLQEALDEPIFWKDICNVEYTNSRVFHNPYLTDESAQTNTRGNTYSILSVIETDESVTINDGRLMAQVIERADLAQSTYTKQMVLAQRQGVILNEAIESAMFVYAGFAGAASSQTVERFTNATIGGSAGSITVSANNIDDIIRVVQEKIYSAAGGNLLARNGGFIVWRPADFTLLLAYMQANGYTTADAALKNGGRSGVEYMGLTHYVSNLTVSARPALLAGVKKVLHLGIVKDTYGQVVVTQDPGLLSGVGVISRVDFQFKAWNKTKSVLFDIAVA